MGEGDIIEINKVEKKYSTMQMIMGEELRKRVEQNKYNEEYLSTQVTGIKRTEDRSLGVFPNLRTMIQGKMNRLESWKPDERDDMGTEGVQNKAIDAALGKFELLENER